MAYPFNTKKLDTDIQSAIDAYSAYETDDVIEGIIERKGLTDAESHVALAFFRWSNAALTQFEEDILQFGAEALEVLNPLLEQEPMHKGANSLKKEIEREMKKAEKIRKKLEKYNKIPEEKLDLYDAKELAYFLSDNNKTDRESKLKQYRLWYRLYKEYPDVTPNTQGGYPDEYYGHNYFYLGYAATALWDAGEREQARPLFWELIEWPVERDVKLYNHIAIVVPPLLLEAIEQDNLTEFRRLIALLKSRAEKLVIYSKHADEILAYAAQREDRETLAYIVSGLMDERSQRSMDTPTKANMTKAKALLGQ